MEESTFDTLLRKAVQQGTRRKALGALIGGALLTTPGEIEANDKAKHRKQRRRDQDGRKISRSSCLPGQSLG
jgi:hypothetical protein